MGAEIVPYDKQIETDSGSGSGGESGNQETGWGSGSGSGSGSGEQIITGPWISYTINVDDTTNEIELLNSVYNDKIESMEIDGTIIDDILNTYRFENTGEHTIKFILRGTEIPMGIIITEAISAEISNNITSIGNGAFLQCSGLTSIIILDSVTEISADAFQDCSGLTSLTIGNSVTSIDTEAFYRCSGLTSVTIPDSVT